MMAKDEPVKSQVTVSQTRKCPNCNSTLQKRSKQRKKFGPESCYHCKGYGLVDDVDRNGRIIKRALRCSACEGTGKKIHWVTVEYLYCSNCGGEFSL